MHTGIVRWLKARTGAFVERWEAILAKEDKSKMAHHVSKSMYHLLRHSELEQQLEAEILRTLRLFPGLADFEWQRSLPTSQGHLICSC